MQTEKQNNHAQLPTVLNYNGAQVSFEQKNGSVMVNAAEMARPFGKRVQNWIRLDSTKEFIKVLKISQNSYKSFAENQLLSVQNGGKHPGTWMHEDVALEFARWLSPEFAIWTNQRIKEMLKGDIVFAVPFNGVSPLVEGGQALYNYVEILKSLGRSTTSGAVSSRKRRFPNHFYKRYGRNFVTLAYAKLLKKEADVEQLKLELFKNEKFIIA